MKRADTILEINNIVVIYNKAVQVLRGLSLSVPRDGCSGSPVICTLPVAR